MPFPNGDPKPGEPGYTGYISPENGGTPGVNNGPGGTPNNGSVDATNVGTGSGSSLEFWNDPNSAWTHDWAAAGKGVNDALTSMGFIPRQVDPNAPGASLDSTQADEGRNRLNPLIAQLQGSARTGDGAWQKMLTDATAKSGGSAQALGQSMPGTGYGASLKNIGNAEGAVSGQAAGQANILRAQQQTGAQDQLANLLAAQGSGDANQAAAAAAAKQGTNELQHQLNSAASSTFEKATGGIGNAFTGAGAAFSDGGGVPGKAKVFGDDEKNDTVPAMLSPGEIVIPRSHTSSPEAAAAFVRALLAKKKIQHLDAGGSAGDGSGLGGGTADAGTTAAQVFLPHIGQIIANGQNNSPAAPSIQNGGLLDTGAYDANRTAALDNSNLLMQRALGTGPSVAPQQYQNTLDAHLADAMRAQGGKRGPSAAETLLGAARNSEAGAGNAAGTKMSEQAAGARSASNALLAQRAADNAIAQAKQQAAFRNTAMNAGLDLAQQAALRGIVGGAGQAATAFSALGKGTDSNDYASRGSPSDLGNDGQFENPVSDPSEFNSYTSPPPDAPDAGSAAGDYNAPSGNGIGAAYGAMMADGGTVKVTAGKPIITKRVPATVEVEAKEPTQIAWVHKPDSPEALRAQQKIQEVKGQNAPFELKDDDDDEFAVQRAQGGEIPPEETLKAKAFLKALRKRRAA